MRIAYIIAPFESSDYLIRCINSIKRQTFSDNEIIIAENSFYKSEKLSKYLANTDKLKLISDKPKDSVEKIREAVSLVSPASVLIKLIAVDTVASPIATAEAHRDGDIIAAGCAERSGDGYRVVEKSLIPDSTKLSLHSLFLKKSVFEQLEDGVFTEKQLFELWLDEQITGGTSIVTTDEICFYTTGKSALQDNEPINTCISCKDRILAIIRKSLAANSVTMFDKYLSRLLQYLFDSKYELSQKNDVFEFIKEMGEFAQSNELAKHLYELYLEGDTAFIQGFDAEGYLLYMDKKNALAKTSFYQASLPKPKPAPAPKPDPIAADVKALRNDLAALSKNMHLVFSSSFAAGAGERLVDPYNQVPEMFSQGRLGMKVILRSIKGWLKYKFSRKKK